MNESDRVKYLRIALRVFGLVFIFGIYPPMGIALRLSSRFPISGLAV